MDNPATGAYRLRDRRNGLTLTEDWNRIRGAHLRIIAAWYDYDEDSGISRTQEYGYKYVDLVKQLITPVTPTLSSVSISGWPPNVLPSTVGAQVPLVLSGANFLPGAVLLFSPDGVNIFQVAATYISPTELHIFPYGGAPPGTYYAAVRNSDNTQSAPIILSVTP